MITKGILKTIDYNENSCMVRLPLFETAASSGEVVLPAIFLTQPGSYNGYDEGDIVFVDFENNSLNNPVVVGKLYLGAAKENSALRKGGLTVADLNVTSGASIPLDTKLVFDKTSSTTVSVDNGLDNYKSIIDIIKALHKNEVSIDKVVDESLDNITNIKVEYLIQLIEEADPTIDNPNWNIAIPTYKDGYAIWQKTTCYNRRGQILGEPEIICLSNTIATTSYWLKCSTKIHSGEQQTTDIILQAMVKIGANTETPNEEDIIKYKWANDIDWISEGNRIVIEASECKDEDLLVEAWRPNGTTSYAAETITFMPKGIPVLDLSRDSASLAYDTKGINKLNITEKAITTASVYFNGEIVTTIPDNNFTWTVTGGTPITSIGSTIEITDIDDEAESAAAECTVTHNGVTLKKTFTVAKIRKGGSTYKLDIENDYVSIITGSNGIINNYNWDENTKHILTVYHGAEIIKTNKIKVEDPKDDGNLYLKVTPSYVTSNTPTATKDENQFINTISAISDTSDVGEIKYQLFEGLTLVASAKFEVLRVRQGQPATSYWLKSSSNVHLGTEQNTDLVVTAMRKEGTTAEAIDETAILWWWNPSIADAEEGQHLVNKWTKASTTSLYSLTFTKDNFKNIIKNNSLKVLATHDMSFEPTADTDFTDPAVYELETLSYSPRNTPILELTNESDALSYNYLGQKLGLDEASTTAKVYLNGTEVTGATFDWKFYTINETGTRTEITNLTETDSVTGTTITNIEVNGATIKITHIPTTKIEAECTASYNWDNQSTTLIKKFTVVRQVQGEAAISHWLKLGSFVHTGENQTTNIKVQAMKKIGTDGAESTDQDAYLWWWNPSLTTTNKWVRAANKNILNFNVSEFKTLIKDNDIKLLATHNKPEDWGPTETTDASTEGVYEFETITYSPLNTPVIDLTNDTASISYKASGVGKIDDNETVSTTATLYLNGNALSAKYSWSLSNCTTDGTSTTASGDTVTVKTLSANNATATVEAEVTADGAFYGKKYTKVFRVNKLLKGYDANSYWLKCSSYIHTGTNQTETLEIAAMTQEGNATEKPDNSAILFYKWGADGEWQTDMSSTLTIEPGNKFENKDLIIKATHDGSLTTANVAESSNASKIYDEETITYSPLNTPVIDLDNDKASLAYTADGTKIDSEIVECTATLYLNGKAIPNTNLSYSWTLTNCTNKSGTSKTSNKISIDAIDTTVTKATAEVTITIDSTKGIDGTGKFKGNIYKKTFTITKQLKGDKGDDGTSAVTYKARLSASSIIKSKSGDSTRVPTNIQFYLDKYEGNKPPAPVDFAVVYIVDDAALTSAQTLSSNNKAISMGTGGRTTAITLYFYTSDSDAATAMQQMKKEEQYLTPVDVERIPVIYNGEDGDPVIVQYAYWWADSYVDSEGKTWNPDFPSDIIDNVGHPDWEQQKWYRSTSAPVVTPINQSFNSSYKIVFVSTCSTTEGQKDNGIWSKPEIFAVANEKAYQILKTSEGLFGYGQGVYYTPTADNTVLKPNSKTEYYKIGDQIPEAEAITWVATDPENRKDKIKLYINAEYIKTGALTVGDDLNNPLFQAGLDNGTVKIAGFNVVGNTLTAGENTNKVSIGTDSIYLGGASLEQAPFGVTKEGALKAASGEIGGFKLTDSEFKITSLDNLGYTKADFLITNTDQEGKLDGGTKYYKAGGRTGTDWRLIVGQLFGVNNEGKLFAQDATVEGTLIGKQGTLENMTSITAEDIYCNSNLNCNNISLGGSGATITTNTTSGSTSEEPISLKLSADQPAPSYIGGNWLFSVKFETTGGEKVAKRCNTGYKLAWATFSCSVDKASGSGTVQDKIFNKVYFGNATIIFSADYTFVINTTSAGGGGASYPASWTLEEVCVVDSNNNKVTPSPSGDWPVAKAEIYKNTVTTNIMFNCGVEAPTMIAEAFYATSDKRLKENIKEYIPQKSILDLPVVEFDFKESGAHQIGCIAQDLQEICPELVTTNVDGYLTISENKLVYLLLEEVKKLNSKVIELEQTLKSERTK